MGAYREFRRRTSHQPPKEVLMSVDRKALLEKLEKMGISAKSVYRENHATVAVEEFVASETVGSIRLHAKDATFNAPGVEETILHICPMCEHEWTTEEEFFGDDAEVDGETLAENVEVSFGGNGPSLSPGSLVLTAEEVAYMVLDFAGAAP